MVAVGKPKHLDGGRQRIRLHFLARSERVAFSLANQGRSLQTCQMICSQVRWAAGRSAPTLLVSTDPFIGLTDEHVDELVGWSAGFNAHAE